MDFTNVQPYIDRAKNIAPSFILAWCAGFMMAYMLADGATVLRALILILFVLAFILTLRPVGSKIVK